MLRDHGASFQLLPWCHACLPALLPAVKVMDSPTEQTLSRGKQIITGKALLRTVATREHSGEWRGTGIKEPHTTGTASAFRDLAKSCRYGSLPHAVLQRLDALHLKHCFVTGSSVFFFLSLWTSSLPFPRTRLFSLISSLGRVSEELKWDHFEKLWSWLPSSFFSCYTTPNKNKLSSARVFLTHRSRLQPITAGKSWRQKLREGVTLHPQSRSREQGKHVATHFSSTYLVQDPREQRHPRCSFQGNTIKLASLPRQSMSRGPSPK